MKKVKQNGSEAIAAVREENKSIIFDAIVLLETVDTVYVERNYTQSFRLFRNGILIVAVNGVESGLIELWRSINSAVTEDKWQGMYDDQPHPDYGTLFLRTDRTPTSEKEAVRLLAYNAVQQLYLQVASYPRALHLHRLVIDGERSKYVTIHTEDMDGIEQDITANVCQALGKVLHPVDGTDGALVLSELPDDRIQLANDLSEVMYGQDVNFTIFTD